jgi:hypothetical protein
MRRLKFVTLALSGSALLSAGAHAQFGGIVHDPTGLAVQLQELNEARKVVQQSAQQLDEARALTATSINDGHRQRREPAQERRRAPATCHPAALMATPVAI